MVVNYNKRTTRVVIPRARVRCSAAPDEGVPQSICFAVEIQLAGKLLICILFCWETLNIFSISIRAGWMRTEIGGDWIRTRSREAYRWFKLSHAEKKTCFDRFGERFRFTRLFAGWGRVTQSRLAGSFPHYLAIIFLNHSGSAEYLFFQQN